MKKRSGAAISRFERNLHRPLGLQEGWIGQKPISALIAIGSWVVAEAPHAVPRCRLRAVSGRSGGRDRTAGFDPYQIFRIVGARRLTSPAGQPGAARRRRVRELPVQKSDRTRESRRWSVWGRWRALG